MKRVVSIDGIPFDNLMFISSELKIDDYIAEKILAIDGSSVLFAQTKGALTKEVIIDSGENGWISKATKDLLIATVDLTSKTVVFDDATTGTYYYDHTKTPITFTELYEGSDWFTIEMNLLKG